MVGFGFSNIFRLLETIEFFFFLGHFQRLISAWTYVFWLITQKNTRKLQYKSPQKKFFGSVRVLEYFSTTQNDRICLFSRTLLETYIRINFVFWFITQENTRKLQYQSPQKKFFGSVSGSRNFSRLLETTDFFFFLGLLERL